MGAQRSPARWLRRSAFALLCAYVLVAQAALAGLASGAHAGPAPVEMLSRTVLCATGERFPDAPAAPHAPPCCAAGCLISGPSGSPPPEAAAFSSRQAHEFAASAAQPNRSVLAASFGPSRARAPPVSA